MKILFLHQFDLNLAGGSGTYLRLVATALTAAGHAVQVVAARSNDGNGGAAFALPFDFTMTFGPERRPGERTFDEFAVPELQHLASRAAEAVEEQACRSNSLPDLLLVNHISMQAEVARQLSTRLGIPYRIISYGTDGQLLERDRRYVEWLRPAVRSAERIFAISAFIAHQVRDVLPEVDIAVLGGAVDANTFHQSETTPNPNRIAFVGRLVTEKGLGTLLDALSGLPDNIVLDVVGEGPLFDTLHASVAQMPRADRVHLLGYLPPADVHDVLTRSSALVAPSVWEEPLGLVVLEAMACGVPVIATAVGGIPELVQPGRNGLLVEPRDPHALATAIRRVVEDRTFHARLVEGCLHETVIPSLSDLIAKVLA